MSLSPISQIPESYLLDRSLTVTNSRSSGEPAMSVTIGHPMSATNTFSKLKISILPSSFLGKIIEGEMMFAGRNYYDTVMQLCTQLVISILEATTA